MIQLRLSLPCPLNALYMAIPMRGKSGGMFQKIVPSKRACERKKLLVAEITEQIGSATVREPLTGPVQIAYTITPRDRRTPDVDAFSKHLLDCLQAAGVIQDDGQVEHLITERLEPKFPGSVLVEIWEIANA